MMLLAALHTEKGLDGKGRTNAFIPVYRAVYSIDTPYQVYDNNTILI